MNLPSTANQGITWLYSDKVEDLESYKDLWAECFNNKEHSIFNSVEWITHWKIFFWEKKWTLHLYIAYKGNKCVLLAPFYIKKCNSFPFIKTLTLLGQGEDEAFEISSEYQDIFVHRNHQNLLSNLLKKVQTLNFDEVNLRALLKGANALQLFSTIKETKVSNIGTRYCFSTQIDSSPKLSKNNKSKLNKCKNKLNALNAMYQWVKEEEHTAYWHYMKDFHQVRWIKLGKTGAFCNMKFSQFHNMYRESNPKNVKISAVLVNDIPIAINYYFTENDTLFFYQSGWDEENYAAASPGFALHIWSMNNCSEDFYDFMMGSISNSYKAKLGCNHNSKMYNVRLVRNKLKQLLAKLLNKLTCK